MHQLFWHECAGVVCNREEAAAASGATGGQSSIPRDKTLAPSSFCRWYILVFNVYSTCMFTSVCKWDVGGICSRFWLAQCNKIKDNSVIEKYLQKLASTLNTDCATYLQISLHPLSAIFFWLSLIAVRRRSEVNWCYFVQQVNREVEPGADCALHAVQDVQDAVRTSAHNKLTDCCNSVSKGE